LIEGWLLLNARRREVLKIAENENILSKICFLDKLVERIAGEKFQQLTYESAPKGFGAVWYI
jgi:capsule polysaccharide export protein KpsC/LpsZ